MPALHSSASRFHFIPWLLVSAWLATGLPPTDAAAQAGQGARAVNNSDTTVGVVESAEGSAPAAECELGSESPECAPDQRLELDAARPARRFASYSDLVALVRGRVSLGLTLSPFTGGPLARLRFEAEVITRLRGQRGVELTARVSALLLGEGLDGLFVGLTGSYLARVQPGGQVLLGAELGYARHFASLYVCAAAGLNVLVWARAPDHQVAPSVRLLLGHAFY
ncbi:MAG: hypothetical protein IPL19_24040 [Sandaracinaceae bacterium]|jgi:hypothetical protein|nr:hypothetical protein [Sandaracinaceae bacterium]MBP7684133.1 hypothetical protein [Deltaproteobacteria bacterium]